MKPANAPKTETETKAKAKGPPRYMKTPSDAIAHIEYVLGVFDERDTRRILAFVTDGLPNRFPKPAPSQDPAPGS